MVDLDTAVINNLDYKISACDYSTITCGPLYSEGSKVLTLDGLKEYDKKIKEYIDEKLGITHKQFITMFGE